MSVPLFRTSLLRSTRVLHGSVRNVSRTLGTVSGNVLVRVVLPSHSVLVRSRNFTTSLAAAAANSASVKKGTTKGTTKGGAVAEKKSTAKKVAKKVVSKEKVAAKKKPVKAKKKVVKPKAPKSMLVCSFQCAYTHCLSVSKRDWLPPFKKPINPWTKFAVEFTKERAGGQKMDLKEGLRAASVEWKNLSEEEKAVCWFICFNSERVFTNTSDLCTFAGR
jgi:hypothetical protein